MGTDLLSRRDVSILKGAGILMIFLHNYLHWERDMGIENEFAFSASGFKAFLDHAFDGPLAFFRYSFAYFGHFGVQLFVLTSGYGLAVSARSKREECYLGYLVPKLIKILALLLLGALVISVVRFIKNGRSFDVGVVAEIVMGRMTSIWNFSGSDIFRYSGPFWFFGLIVQLYVLFPFLNRAFERFSSKGAFALVAGIIVLNAVLYPIAQRYDVPLMGIFMGHLPVFLFGMLLARQGLRIHPGLVVAALGVFLLGQFHVAFFTATFLAAAICMISGFLVLRQLGNTRAGQWVGELLVRVGDISMAIFILNGPLRGLDLFRDAQGDLLSSRLPLFTLILFLLAVPVAFLFKRLAAGMQFVCDRLIGMLSGTKGPFR